MGGWGWRGELAAISSSPLGLVRKMVEGGKRTCAIEAELASALIGSREKGGGKGKLVGGLHPSGAVRVMARLAAAGRGVGLPWAEAAGLWPTGEGDGAAGTGWLGEWAERPFSISFPFLISFPN